MLRRKWIALALLGTVMDFLPCANCITGKNHMSFHWRQVDKEIAVAARTPGQSPCRHLGVFHHHGADVSIACHVPLPQTIHIPIVIRKPVRNPDPKPNPNPNLVFHSLDCTALSHAINIIFMFLMTFAALHLVCV
ncbi:uncharacterized protein LOC117145391 [Drosophila mauritiana]|uniref:Uncharacterized protein LOC117145391 n=1 Tax=Drosophila mauritiana TaxID=7226 RepID=A0A6P8KDH7_DROMA|nr:uncharacterized protein LOC117145391 [Drosophila mauritiana]